MNEILKMCTLTMDNTYHRAAILIGVVKHDVNKSAGNSGCIGSV